MSEEITINQGFVYHIKDSYFEVAQDNMLMRNHEGGAYRPTYICIKDDKTNLFWAIPMSRQVEKYKKVVDKDIKLYGNCVKILIARYGETQSAFLFQNMFPIIEKYIDHIHTIGGNPVQVDSSVKEKVTQIFKENIRLHKRGVKVIFTDIDRLVKLMLDEFAEGKITLSAAEPTKTPKLPQVKNTKTLTEKLEENKKRAQLENANRSINAKNKSDKTNDNGIDI